MTTIRQEMLRAARVAPRLLEKLRAPVVDFILNCQAPDGGFVGRSDTSDLYYTVFALESLRALGVAVPSSSSVARYLTQFGRGEGLDFVHLACLARCWLSLTPDHPLPEEVRLGLPPLLESYRAANGGYSYEGEAARGTAYAAFLALGAYQDLGRPLPRESALRHAVQGLRSGDGAYGNGPGLSVGMTPVTAAAVTVLRHLGESVEPFVGEWLLARCLPKGGFLAMPEAPMPDLLSTATALHALAGIGTPIDRVREPCLDFLDRLWADEDGGFRGIWVDPVVDCEYTFYGLLALGHLY